MHIQEGVLSGSPEGIAALAAGAVLTVIGTAIGLRRVDYDRIPRIAVISSAFFVASLIHIPIGPSSTHLILNGLAGIILGWACFPALLIALFLQALLFGYGGLTTLGLNTFNMALPAIMCYGLFRACAGINVLKGRIFMCGFLAGVGAILLAAVLAGSELLITDSGFRSIVGALFIAHIPVMVIEGFITGSIAAFLMKVRPEMLEVGKEHREEIEKK